MDWHKLFKGITGLFVVPISIGASYLWPWWSERSIGTKVLTAPLVLPVVGLAYVLSFWWDEF